MARAWRERHHLGPGPAGLGALLADKQSEGAAPAAANGAAVATVAVHFAESPWHRQGVVPLVTAAEGLPERALGPYNFILLTWSATAITALACETRGGERIAALGGLATFWPARAGATPLTMARESPPEVRTRLHEMIDVGSSVTAGGAVLSLRCRWFVGQTSLMMGVEPSANWRVARDG
jgi:hypothetical protein